VLYTTLALAFWLLLILFTAIGVYRLGELFGKGKLIDWLLLPGTIVGELAYVFGCLITGAEVRGARLFPSGRGQASMTQATPAIKVIGPLLAAAIALVCGIGAIVATHRMLDEPVIREFIVDDTSIIPSVGANLAGQLPTTSQEFWDLPVAQVKLVRKMYQTLLTINWGNWRVPLFVYIALCLSVRLAPIRRPVRPALGAAVLAPGIVALAQLAGANLASGIEGLWFLLTYIWASLLLALIVLALIRGGIYLVNVLRGKTGA